MNILVHFPILEMMLPLVNNVKIYPNVYIGDNSIIGNNCTLFSGVKYIPKPLLEKTAKIHSGAIIGSDGFGFAPDENGAYQQFHKLEM